MSSSEYKLAKKKGLLYDPRKGKGIPTTSAAKDPVNPSKIRDKTGAVSADYYIDYDVSGLPFFTRATKGGWPEYVIQGNLTPNRIVESGRVPNFIPD